MSLVEVYATVTDARGEPVKGLRQEDFVIEEDGARQTLHAFAAGEFPLALAIGIDHSFSVTAAGLQTVKAAVGHLLDELRADDQAMLLAIGSETDVLSELSTDRREARASLDRLDPWGTTPLYDATLTAVDAIQSAPGRRALILISDGSDRYSLATASSVLERVRKQDVMIYPIALGKTRPEVFVELAAVTGGRSFQVADLRTLSATLSTIARELREQYLLGYAPPTPARPGWHSIQVRVNRPDTRVRARDGYEVVGRP